MKRAACLTVAVGLAFSTFPLANAATPAAVPSGYEPYVPSADPSAAPAHTVAPASATAPLPDQPVQLVPQAHAVVPPPASPVAHSAAAGSARRATAAGRPAPQSASLAPTLPPPPPKWQARAGEPLQQALDRLATLAGYRVVWGLDGVPGASVPHLVDAFSANGDFPHAIAAMVGASAPRPYAVVFEGSDAGGRVVVVSPFKIAVVP